MDRESKEPRATRDDQSAVTGPGSSRERWRVLWSLLYPVLSVLVAATSTLSLELFLNKTPLTLTAYAIVGAAVALLAAFTLLAQRERAGPRPLAKVTEHVVAAFLAGLDASPINPRQRHGGNHG